MSDKSPMADECGTQWGPSNGSSTQWGPSNGSSTQWGPSNGSSYLAELAAATKKTPKYTLSGLKTYAKCVDVYDGDTIQLVFSPGAGQPIRRYSCRMRGYNSAEMKGPGVGPEEKARAVVARDALRALILGEIVRVVFYDFDKYGRPLVDVQIGDTLVCAYMISGGYGAPYSGRGEKKY